MAPFSALTDRSLRSVQMRSTSGLRRSRDPAAVTIRGHAMRSWQGRQRASRWRARAVGGAHISCSCVRLPSASGIGPTRLLLGRYLRAPQSHASQAGAAGVGVRLGDARGARGLRTS